MPSRFTRSTLAPPRTYPNATTITAHACRKSAGTLTQWWGTKNDRIMNNPIAPVMKSGTSRFTRRLLLGREPCRQPVDADGLEHAAEHDDDDDHDLDEV